MDLQKYKSLGLVCLLVILLVSIIKILSYAKKSQTTGDIEYLYTKEFTHGWEINKNKDDLFYDEKTFGIILFSDPCYTMTTRDYRKYINSSFNCTGKWCRGGKYSCERSNSRDCYNVEHIIDKKGREFVGCNKNIVGNYVMAWGKWNQNLGLIARRNYYSSSHEKKLVYGEFIMEKVRGVLKVCCEKTI